MFNRFMKLSLTNKGLVLGSAVWVCTVIYYIGVGLSGCTVNDRETNREVKHYDSAGKLVYESRVIGNRVLRISEVNIDGCDYIFAHSGEGIALTHKGNCKNLIHSPYKETR